MNKQPENKDLIGLFESLALDSVLLDTKNRQDVALFIEKLKNAHNEIKRKDLKNAQAVLQVFLNSLILALKRGNDNIKAIIILGMDLLKPLIVEQNKDDSHIDIKEIKLMFIHMFHHDEDKKHDTVIPEKSNIEPIAQNIEPSSLDKPIDPIENEYVCKIPDIDFEDNKGILLEFINETADHMNTAEESLLVLENSPENQEEINRIFRAFHTIKGLTGFLNLNDIKTLSHETETMMSMVRNNSLKMENEVVDGVFASIDATRKLINLLQEQLENNGKLKSKYLDISPIIKNIRDIISGVYQKKKIKVIKARLGEILVDNKIIEGTDLDIALEIQEDKKPDNRLGEILVDMKLATDGQVTRALQEQQKGFVSEQIVKIGVSKLDNLVDMVGELVIIGTQILQNQLIKSSQDDNLGKDVSQLDRIIRSIQDISMSMRLVPIRPVFQKMLRFIRDISRKCNKPVEIKLFGEDTEIDKNIIDLITDPLMHMVRNAVDHGIEEKAQRKALGKPEVGVIELHAYHKGNNIVVEVRDDGCGLEKQKILKKAIEKGLLQEKDNASENKIYSNIFEPGFSTAEVVTEVSGRGVGMDVVKRNIEQLRGKVDIATKEGSGTTFTIKLPLTLAVIDGIIIAVGKKKYIIPIYSVIEFFSPKNKDIVLISGKPMAITVHGNILQIINLSEYFKERSIFTNLEDSTFCVVESDYGHICFVVDAILGQQQVVIKNLGETLNNIRGIAGGTILGDGLVGLILDVNGIVKHMIGDS